MEDSNTLVTSQNIQNSGETEKADIQKREKDYTPTIAVLLVIIHFVFLMAYFEPAISTPDANGYFVQAKLIAKEHRTYFKTESIIQYVGIHWHRAGNNGYFSEYPPGFPAILAVVFWIFGPEATLLVNPLMASVSLFALFLTCRVWIGRWWRLLAAALMAFNPIANQHALAADSHTATLFFLIWALYFIARWNNTHSLWWSFGTGLFLGIIPTIRYPEVLFTIAFGLFLMLNLRGDRTVWRSLIAGVIGFALPFGTLCIRNHLAFGAFWKTGYSLLNRPIGFGWNYFITHSIHYLQELQSEGCGLMFGLGLIGIAALCARRDTWKRSIFLAVLILPITLLYMAYFWPPDHASMRFLLPTFPVYTIASVWLLQMLSENQRKAAYGGSAVLLFFMISWGLPLSIQPMKNLESTNAALVQVTRALKNHAEPGSIVIANKHILQHIDFVGYWHLADELVNRARPFPLRFDDNNVDETIQQRRMEDRQQRFENLYGPELFYNFSHDIWQWADGYRKVYCICNEPQLNLYKRQLNQGEHLTVIEKIKLPRRTVRVFDARGEVRPPIGPAREPMAPFPQPTINARFRPDYAGGMQQQFDFLMNGEPMLLVEWTQKIQ